MYMCVSVCVACVCVCVGVCVCVCVGVCVWGGLMSVSELVLLENVRVEGFGTSITLSVCVRVCARGGEGSA